jgi:GNAT superfamily N-acetyltransferase
MTEQDVAPAARVWFETSADYDRRYVLPPYGAMASSKHREPGAPDRPDASPRREDDVAQLNRLELRMGHLRRTDPDGSWVAEEDGRVVGLGQSFIREGYWVLSLLGVAPFVQSSGLGRALLQRTLVHRGTTRGTIQSSRDPRAIRLYAGAGFAVHPVVRAVGTLHPGVHGSGASDLRVGSPADLDLVSNIDRSIRGAARPGDIEHLLRVDGATLLLDSDRAYVVAKADRVITAAGRDVPSALRVLGGAMALAPAGGPFRVDWITTAQSWVVAPVLAAGLELIPAGPVMTFGMPGPPTPAIPSGGYG